MIKVSIIMPVYNAEGYLSETLDSVVNQVFKNYELIAINDGSLDNSLEILESYKSQIPNLKIINQPNSGVSSTRNKGIDLASGKYICFLDADDYLSPNYLSFLHEQSENNQSDITCCSYFTFSIKNRIKEKKHLGCTQQVTFTTLRSTGLATSLWTKMYKRELIINSGVRFNPESTYGEDYFFNWKLYLLTNKTYYTNRPLYGYRQSLYSATAKYHPHLLETYLNEYELLRAFASQKGLLSDQLTDEIEKDLIYRIPAILRMNFRSSLTIFQKINYIKTLVNLTQIQRSVYHFSSITHNKIANHIKNKRYIALFIYSFYMEVRFSLISFVKKII